MFAVGVVLRSIFDFGAWTLMFSLLLVAGVVLMYPVCQRREIYVTFLISVIALCLGIVRMHASIVMVEEDPSFSKEEVELVGEIVREPDVRDTYTNLVLSTPETSQHILVRTDSYTQFLYKDIIRVTGVQEPVTNFEGEGGRVFDYRGYLAKDNIRSIVAFPEITTLEHQTTPVGYLLKLKGVYLESLKRMLPEPSAALAGGITVGERRSLGEELTEDFRATGLIHIIVLSGYNIAIIVVAISILLSFLPAKPRFTIAILVIVLFTILVGASATVVRAAIMGSIGAVGVMAGRTYSALHALMFAALAMLLWNPYLLMFDPSFQLSFVATLGLILGVPLLLPYLDWIPDKFGMRELTAATIATQVAVYPLLIYMMGEASLVALPVNLLVLPIIPLAMLAVFLVGVFGSVSFAVALPFAYFAHGALLYVFKIVELFASLAFSTVTIPAFSFWYVATIYILLGIAVWYLNGQVKEKTTPCTVH